MTRQFSSRAIVLHSDTLGDIDMMVTLLTSDFGKMRCVAKGARKSKRRFMNALEPFTLIEAGMSCRQRAGLSLVEFVNIESCFEGFRTDYASFVYGSLALELTDAMCRQWQQEKGIFCLLEWYLKKMDEGCCQRLCTAMFKARLLKETGFFPRLDEAVELSMPAMKTLEYFCNSSLERIFRIRVSVNVLEETWAYLKRCLCHVLEFEPRSYRMVKGLST